MVSLKLTPKEAKAEGYAAPAEPQAPEFPYGTRLEVMDETAKALFPKAPDVGQVVKIDGLAIVTSINITKQQEGGDRLFICLQVTDLEVKPTEEKKGAAEVLYGDK